VNTLALVVLVLGFLVVSQAWPVDPDLEAVCPPFGETESYTIEPVWWPPGGERCTVGDGSSKTTYPWREYLTVVLLALSVAVLRLRPLRMLASLAIFLAAMAVFWL
jgi:hypothetical protein